jgi:hypothetical protein
MLHRKYYNGVFRPCYCPQTGVWPSSQYQEQTDTVTATNKIIRFHKTYQLQHNVQTTREELVVVVVVIAVAATAVHVTEMIIKKKRENEERLFNTLYLRRRKNTEDQEW